MKPANRERKLVLLFCGAVLLVIAAVSFLAPPNDDSDKSPTTYNNGTAGIKVAYLLLGDLGYTATRWEQSPAELAGVDASRTTVIFAQPEIAPEKIKDFRNDVSEFLKRGGRVIVTGQEGAELLADGATAMPTQSMEKMCVTTPEDRSPLARAGEVSMTDDGRWANLTPAVQVEQWCGSDAVVVSYHVGAGTVIWWSSDLPLTNGGLKENASLKLLLASVAGVNGKARSVLFDEYFHGAEGSVSDLTRGLPLAQIGWQMAAVALLLMLSFGRRSGPVRQLAPLPRSSPVEFAESMGQLYRKAGATQAATEGARNRLARFLRDCCGVPREVVQSDAATIAEAINSRVPGDWIALGGHLAEAAEAQYRALAPRSALTLVKALDRDRKTLADRTTTSHAKRTDGRE